MSDNELEYNVVGCILEVYHQLGPGLLESCYEKALMICLEEKGLKAVSQVDVPISFHDHQLEHAFRIDILIEDKLILELKSVENLSSVCYKQLYTYLKLINLEHGILVNFNVDDILKDGIFRLRKSKYLSKRRFL